MCRNIPCHLVAAIFMLILSDTGLAQGLALSGIGAINQGMGGAATAAPIDAAGALYWNPATISGLASSEVSFGLALALPSEKLSSSLPAGAIGGGLPPFSLQGSEMGEAGSSPLPNVAYVEKNETSAWTYGLGVAAIGGFRANYGASLTNPILMAPPPTGFGIGNAFAQAELLQVAPTLSYAFTDYFSVGFSPTMTMAKFTVDPLLFAMPDDANQDGFANYPSGIANRWIYGGGFQIGMYYIATPAWRFGAAIKSKQWFERVRFKTSDELGRPTGTQSFAFEYPFILTTGVSYNGFERSVIAIDFRFFDYSNAAGFKESGFAANGAIRGLGWDSIFATSLGVQHQLTEYVYLRTGYSYNQNPISSEVVGFNIASPTITQHFLYLGSTVQFSQRSSVSLTYAHAFENEVSGPIQTPSGPIPGSNITNQVSLDALAATITVKY